MTKLGYYRGRIFHCRSSTDDMSELCLRALRLILAKKYTISIQVDNLQAFLSPLLLTSVVDNLLIKLDTTMYFLQLRVIF